MGAAWQTTLLAVDGDVTEDVTDQLKRLPRSATHLVVSVGGNDALRNYEVLELRVKTAGEGFLKLAQVRDDFQRAYQRMLDVVLKKRLPTIVCTVYDPNFPNDDEQQMTVAALAAYNDVIMRAVFQHGLPVIDLRLLFSDTTDYANPIEPAPAGGAKIAREVARIVHEHDFTTQRTVIYGG